MEQGLTGGECVFVVQASFVPLWRLYLHVSRSTAGQTLGHKYFVAGLRVRFSGGQAFAHRTHFVSRVLGNNVILNQLLAGLCNRIILKGAEQSSGPGDSPA